MFLAILTLEIVLQKEVLSTNLSKFCHKQAEMLQ